MLEEKDVLRSTAPISSAMDTRRCRNSSNSMGSRLFIVCERSFFAYSDIHKERRNLLPVIIFRLFDDVAVRGRFGPNTQRSCRGLLLLRGSIGGGPGLTPVVCYVFFVLTTIERGIDPERSFHWRIEQEALNRGHAAFFENGSLAPRFAAVGGDQEKR